MPRIAVNKEFKALGTTVYLEIIVDSGDKKRADKSIDEAESIVAEKEKRLSRFDPGSELSRLNSSLGSWHKASEDILHLAENSLEYHIESGGLFDPRVINVLESIGYRKGLGKDDFQKIGAVDSEMAKTGLDKDLFVKDGSVMFKERMDFAGIAKGYICDFIAGYFKNEGWNDFLVDTGGDIFFSGRNLDGSKWIADIEGIDQEKVMLGLSDEAIATSGITRRLWKVGDKEFHHLVNPKDPNDFQTDFLSVSVVSKTAENADVWAKILFLSGVNAIQLARDMEIKAIFRNKDGGQYLSEKIRPILIR